MSRLHQFREQLSSAPPRQRFKNRPPRAESRSHGAATLEKRRALMEAWAMFIDERKVPTRLRGMHDGRQTAVWRIEGSRWYDGSSAPDRRTSGQPDALRVAAERCVLPPRGIDGNTRRALFERRHDALLH